MNRYLTSMAAFLQVLFQATAETLGRKTGFIQRQRRLTAADFAQTLVFEWMAQPKATLESLAFQLDITPQALQQRCGPPAQAFLRALLSQALQKAMKVPAKPLGLLSRFCEVIDEDTTVVALPDDLADAFPGCGGSDGHGRAALKVLIRWELRSGELRHLSVHAGRTSDQELAAQAEDVPEGGLHLADLGFFNTERWRRFGPRQYWISRVPARTSVQRQGVWQALSSLLSSVHEALFDQPVHWVERTGLPCRLVAQRCPTEIANRRRQKLREYTRSKKGREPSAAQLQLCDWLVFATNVPAEMRAAKEVWVVYRCRWQIELLFKRAKQLAGWGFSWGRCGARIMTELLAKLLGLAVLHWGSLLGGGPLNGISLWKRMRMVQRYAARLGEAVRQGEAALGAVLAELAKKMGRIAPQPKGSKRVNTQQLLLHPELMP